MARDEVEICGGVSAATTPATPMYKSGAHSNPCSRVRMASLVQCGDAAWELYCLEHGLVCHCDGVSLSRTRVSFAAVGRSVLCRGAEGAAVRCETNARPTSRCDQFSSLQWGAGKRRGSDRVRGCCFQDAVLRCCNGEKRRRVRRRLNACRDGSGSGLGGSFGASCNFAAVGMVLCEECAFVWVVARVEGTSWRR